MTQQSLWGGEQRDTLLEARRQVEHGRDEGVTCPCCGQFAKVYRRKLNRSMALALLALERHARSSAAADEGPWVHLFAFLGERGIQHSDAPTLRHWRLIEARGDERPDGNPKAGFYRITTKGRDFARRPDMTLPKHALIYNDELLGFSEETTSIREALGDRFNYAELMAGS